jgi:hypothetical protein
MPSTTGPLTSFDYTLSLSTSSTRTSSSSVPHVTVTFNITQSDGSVKPERVEMNVQELDMLLGRMDEVEQMTLEMSEEA